jgi:hypothetical protein
VLRRREKIENPRKLRENRTIPTDAPSAIFPAPHLPVMLAACAAACSPRKIFNAKNVPRKPVRNRLAAFADFDRPQENPQFSDRVFWKNSRLAASFAPRSRRQPPKNDVARIAGAFPSAKKRGKFEN